MQINKHGSFYIRNGWPTKIIDAINENANIFSPNNEANAVDNIGVGRVMVKALRYWSTAMGITIEGKNQQGICHTLSGIGEMINRSIFRNSFIPLINRLHSKSVSFSLIFFLNMKFDLLVFGNTILQEGLCFVECVKIKLFPLPD